MTPYYEEAGITIYHADCRGVLPELSGVNAILTDPPWGAQTQVDNRRFSGGMCGHEFVEPRERIVGDRERFNPCPLLGFKKVVLWGGQWYADRLPASGGWLVWDKREGIEDVKWPIGEAELAWTNLSRAVHVFRNRWMGLIRDSERGEHYHPTQKPLALMKWCIQRMGDVWTVGIICDPYMGSGTTLRAAKDMGLRAIGIEIEERYCEIAANRLRQSVFNFNEISK